MVNSSSWKQLQRIQGSSHQSYLEHQLPLNNVCFQRPFIIVCKLPVFFFFSFLWIREANGCSFYLVCYIWCAIFKESVRPLFEKEGNMSSFQPWTHKSLASEISFYSSFYFLSLIHSCVMEARGPEETQTSFPAPPQDPYVFVTQV